MIRPYLKQLRSGFVLSAGTLAEIAQGPGFNISALQRVAMRRLVNVAHPECQSDCSARARVGRLRVTLEEAHEAALPFTASQYTLQWDLL